MNKITTKEWYNKTAQEDGEILEAQAYLGSCQTSKMQM